MIKMAGACSQNERVGGVLSKFKKYMEIGRHRGIIANAHIKIGSNSYEKVKTFK